MQKITPTLWYDDKAEEAAEFYISTFGDGAILNVSRYGDDGPGTPGSAMIVDFELFGQRFNGLNGGPMFTFTEAISMSVSCDGQEEVDRYWDALVSDGGAESQCGWCKDRFGVSWQIVPVQLMHLMSNPDPQVSQRVMQSMLSMRKIVIADLQRAHDAA
ncbi:3-demethylubiquinone-9 3-methyltransferase [Rhodococcus sp. Leaf7]|jgi:predicted 3-demethylubiquinone-9 3-methyltransferase (glyoxalase superfamily)|uniref:VOC family protein n=1 Tax=unclassified Rhodococcus (in: high G+C Gram-positive bacteria) TaxID=192944 RepID=UPI0005ACC768|nr:MULTISPECIES: VOC family protein [unclassified Rhodococcus (in: high G+C Gram-positive bacteria)]KIQ17582.1 3-demethylubiquinone-9 3-methyltransferase [Rhodococcus sp. MEB064]KQU06933.1 3-demethylubiquinone-9 3-methyltransferase [Rhodococcus sp. Leaf7]KQU42452.1 3-demethylubiquinone-9 3-methyltransferase [Rhodococcus sp. Leaf247]